MTWWKIFHEDMMTLITPVRPCRWADDYADVLMNIVSRRCRLMFLLLINIFSVKMRPCAFDIFYDDAVDAITIRRWQTLFLRWWHWLHYAVMIRVAFVMMRPPFSMYWLSMRFSMWLLLMMQHWFRRDYDYASMPPIDVVSRGRRLIFSIFIIFHVISIIADDAVWCRLIFSRCGQRLPMPMWFLLPMRNTITQIFDKCHFDVGRWWCHDTPPQHFRLRRCRTLIVRMKHRLISMVRCIDFDDDDEPDAARDAITPDADATWCTPKPTADVRLFRHWVYDGFDAEPPPADKYDDDERCRHWWDVPMMMIRWWDWFSTWLM